MLDIRTIFALLVVSSVLMTVILSFGLRAGVAAGFAKWNLGLGCIAVAWILIGARPALPRLVGYALADATMLTGLCLQVVAMLEFAGRRAARVIYAAPGPLLFAAVLVGGAQFPVFTLMVSVAFAAALVAIGLLGLPLRRVGVGPVRWMMVAFYSLAAALLLARALDVWLFPEQHPDVFARSALQSATFLAQFAVTIAGSFGFLVMQRERAEARLHGLAMHDPLTGLSNRRDFMERAEALCAGARRHGRELALLMIDIDRFKEINDRHGHAAGDDVLMFLAALFSLQVRGSDLCGRIGGEEFAVVLAETPVRGGAVLAERMRRAAEGAAIPSSLAPDPLRVTISVGVAGAAGAAVSLDALLAEADRALYRAKREGRNRVCVAGEEPAPRGAGPVAQLAGS